MDAVKYRSPLRKHRVVGLDEAIGQVSGLIIGEVMQSHPGE